MKSRIAGISLLLAAAIAMSACGTQPLPIPTPGAEGTAPAEGSETPGEGTPIPETGVTRLTGDIEMSQQAFLDIYFVEPFVLLQDMTGFIKRDFEYEQPENAQVLGQVTISEDGALTYVLNLPAAPSDPLNDVDNNGETNSGVQVWQVVFDGNFTGSPFTSKYEFSGTGWGVNFTSAKISSDDRYEVKGGKLVVWAPDEQQEFPIWFGPDGHVFTADDPVAPLPQGYTVIDLDTNPFTFSQLSDQSITVYEGDLSVHDYSEMSYSEAFDALVKNASIHYPFTELKQVDWEALHDEYAPRFKEAEDKKDPQLYYEALRDFSQSIPDSHISAVGGDDFGDFQTRTAASFGFAMTKLDDGSVIVSYVAPGGVAEAAGIQWGATITGWNGKTVDEVADQTYIPTNWALDIPRRLQEYRYMVITADGTTVDLTYTNPGSGEQTTTLTAAPDSGAVLRRTSFNYGRTQLALPVEYKLLPSGLGYIKINTFSDDINLTMRLWERAISIFSANEIPGLVIDLRQNSGGQPLGTLLAGYFATEKKELIKSYSYSETTGKFEAWFPPQYYEPREDLHYGGKVSVLVGPACASACEEMAYVFSQLPDVDIVGMYPSAAALGEVARGQYSLPEGWSYQIPDGYVTDLEGNVVVEGIGVVPTVQVPITVETIQAIFIDNADPILDAAIEALAAKLPQ